MKLPEIVTVPAFNITRTSHVVLEVADLDASREFYVEVIGLIPTLQGADALHLRGIEEACHHSPVLRKGSGGQACRRIGLRVLTEKDLDIAEACFRDLGCAPRWTEVPFQGRTLHVTDPFGVPLELCASMPTVPRQITRFHLHRGGCAQRIDHFQILIPDVPGALDFYTRLGFRLTEYIATDEDLLRGVFLQRKGNPHDLVFFHGAGPRLHHVAYLAQEGQNLLKACDVAGALGFGAGVERGPGRHGPGHASYVYFRDPDGYRVELFNTHYQVMDLEIEPVRWNPADPAVAHPWGLPAQKSWFMEAAPFAGTPIAQPEAAADPMTLERYLAAKEA